MRETWVQPLGQEDPLEKEMATHSSILAWRIPWAEEPGGLQSTGSQRVGHNWVTSLSFFLSFFTHLRNFGPKHYTYTIGLIATWVLGFQKMARNLSAPAVTNWGLSPEEAMASHSSILAREIPWAEEPGGLQSTGSQRVRQEWARTNACIPRDEDCYLDILK